MLFSIWFIYFNWYNVKKVSMIFMVMHGANKYLYSILLIEKNNIALIFSIWKKKVLRIIFPVSYEAIRDMM